MRYFVTYARALTPIVKTMRCLFVCRLADINTPVYAFRPPLAESPASCRRLFFIILSSTFFIITLSMIRFLRYFLMPL